MFCGLYGVEIQGKSCPVPSRVRLIVLLSVFIFHLERSERGIEVYFN